MRRVSSNVNLRVQTVFCFTVRPMQKQNKMQRSEGSVGVTDRTFYIGTDCWSKLAADA